MNVGVKVAELVHRYGQRLHVSGTTYDVPHEPYYPPEQSGTTRVLVAVASCRLDRVDAILLLLLRPHYHQWQKRTFHHHLMTMRAVEV